MAFCDGSGRMGGACLVQVDIASDHDEAVASAEGAYMDAS